MVWMHERFSEMTEAEKMVQEYTEYTWSWMNHFIPEPIRVGMLKMAQQIIDAKHDKPEELQRCGRYLGCSEALRVFCGLEKGHREKCEPYFGPLPRKVKHD